MRVCPNLSRRQSSCLIIHCPLSYRNPLDIELSKLLGVSLGMSDHSKQELAVATQTVRADMRMQEAKVVRMRAGGLNTERAEALLELTVSEIKSATFTKAKRSKLSSLSSLLGILSVRLGNT